MSTISNVTIHYIFDLHSTRRVYAAHHLQCSNRHFIYLNISIWISWKCFEQTGNVLLRREAQHIAYIRQCAWFLGQNHIYFAALCLPSFSSAYSMHRLRSAINSSTIVSCICVTLVCRTHCSHWTREIRHKSSNVQLDLVHLFISFSLYVTFLKIITAGSFHIKHWFNCNAILIEKLG